MRGIRFLRWGLSLALLIITVVQLGCGGGDANPERRLKAAAATTAAVEPAFLFYGTTYPGSGPYPSTLVSISPVDGRQALLGTVAGSTRAANAIDVDPLTGALYGVDGSATPGALLGIDLKTGLSTTVGTVRDAAGQVVTMGGLTFAADGTMYVAALATIGRVDRSTYRYTELLVLPATEYVTSIEMSPSGVLYAVYNSRPSGKQTLVSIDPETKAVTRQIDINGSFMVGDLDFAPDGYLYHTNYSNLLARIDPANGLQTPVGLGSVTALAALASPPSLDVTALFDWAERTYPEYFPSQQSNRTSPPWVYRYYPESGNYVGVSGTTVAVLGPMTDGVIHTVGQVADFACQVRPTTCSPPSISAQPASVSVTAPAAAVFTVAAGGSPAPSYQWQVSSDGSSYTNIEGAKSPSYSLATTALADHGKRFRVVIANAAGSATSSAATLSVYPVIGSYAFSAIAAKMTVPRAMHTATTLADGKVLVTGGTSTNAFPGPALNTAEIYDPVAGTFRELTARLRSPRVQHTATLLADGKVLLAGGQADTNDGDGVATAELFDPTTQTFTSLAASMASPRGGHAATLLPSGKVLLVGGFNRGAGTLKSDAELYDPVARTFAALSAKMLLLTEGHRATLLPDGKVLITGGAASNSIRLVPELFDPVTQTFSASSARMSTPRGGHESTRLPTGAVLVSGGATVFSPTQLTALRSAEAFDPATSAFSPLSATMVVPRATHAAALLSDGSVLLVGGISSGANGSFAILDTAEVFKPAVVTAKPTVTLSAEPPSLLLGASTTLRWSSTSADSCSATGSWSGSRATSGAQSITPATSGTLSYNLSCTGPGGTASAAATVVVQIPPPVPTVSLSAGSASAPAGSVIALQWNSTNASSCTASGAWAGSKASSGAESVQAGTAAGARTFTLTCTGAGGSASSTVTVNVTDIACAQIGGVWTETARVIGTCVPADDYDSGTVSGIGTIVQNGCNISYTVAGIPRTGKVTGFTLTLTGPVAVAGPDITLTANTITITGNISADARRITATGVGQLGGVFNDGFSQMCTLTSTSTMTR